MSDSSNKSNIGFGCVDYEYVLRITDFDAAIEMAKSGGEWWLPSDEEDKIRTQLVQEGKGGLAADIIIGQINRVRFKRHIGEEFKPDAALMNPISGGWLR